MPEPSKHLLLVEDEAALRQAIAEQLGDRGYLVEQADSGEFNYTPTGHPAVSVSVRSWGGNVEARIRPAAVRKTQTVTGATSTASPLPVATEPLPTSTVATPPPPPLPVDASPVTSALPATPTVTLPDLP